MVTGAAAGVALLLAVAGQCAWVSYSARYVASSDHGRDHREELHLTITGLLHASKGILAADESEGTFGKRVVPLGMQNTPEVRRTWRELLFAAPGLRDAISGVILHEETMRQHDSLGVSLPSLLAHQGILVGVKVDQGTAPALESPDDLITMGLDGLDERLALHKSQGASFVKWRAVFQVPRGGEPLAAAPLQRNAQDLAAYAAAAQRYKHGLVPIVEPEVLSDGEHMIDDAAQAARQVLLEVFSALRDRGDVELGALLLKAAMVTPGRRCKTPASPHAVAAATMAVLNDTVPPDVPGIVFLSGGQSEQEATSNLRAFASGAAPQRPWRLSFSFGRALQASGLQAYAAGDLPAAQALVRASAEANSLALQGR